MKFGTSIKFGLLSVDVNQHSIRNKGENTLKLSNLCECHRQPYKAKKVCSIEGKEQPTQSKIKGFKIGKNEFIELKAEEIEAIKETGKGINIECFTPKHNISPIDFVETFYLEATNNYEVYNLLRDKLTENNLIAVTRVISRGKERIGIIQPYLDFLQLVYLETHNNIEITTKETESNKENIKLFDKLIKKHLKEKFDLKKDFNYNYLNKVQELIEIKAKGGSIKVESKEKKEEKQTSDLLKAMVE